MILWGSIFLSIAGRYSSHHLQWLIHGVDLLIGYVDLRYGCPFQELADLSQRTDRRKVAPISLVQPLLMVAALSDGHTPGHGARVEALEELNLEPGGHDPLCKKPLQGGGVLSGDLFPHGL